MLLALEDANLIPSVRLFLMKPTHKPVCSCGNGEYSAMALGFASGFDQKMSEPWAYMLGFDESINS